MISYNAGISQSPPISPEMRRSALAGLAAQGVGPYPQPFSDVYAGRSQAAAADLERAAVRANNEHLANTQEAQRAAALQGGGLMAHGQQNANTYGNQQRGMALDYAGQMMGGLNNLLAGLYS